jgi:hypothetical protein
VPLSVVLSALKDEKQDGKSSRSECDNCSEATPAGEDLPGLRATVHLAQKMGELLG